MVAHAMVTVLIVSFSFKKNENNNPAAVVATYLVARRCDGYKNQFWVLMGNSSIECIYM